MSQLPVQTNNKKSPTGVILFWTLSALYIILYILKRMEVMSNTWLMNYASDLLCMPLTLSLAEWLYFKIRKQKITLSFRSILIITGYVGLIFEWLLPALSTQYTADLFDILWYFIGGVSYAFYKKKKDAI